MTESYANDFFTILQYAQETTPGTAVAAAKIFPGESPKIVSDVKADFIDEKFNIRIPTRRAVVHEQLYLNTLSMQKAGFQQLLLPLQCGLKGLAAPTETTSGQGDFPWDFTPNLTPAAGLNAPKSASLEPGDNVQAYQVEYVMFDKITIKGDIPQDGGPAPVSIEASYFGRRIQTHAFTAALSLATVTPMNAKLARLYMDTTWAGLGGTELAALLRGFQIEIMTGVHPDFTGSANTYFGAHKEGQITFNATFTVEGGTTAHAILAAQQAATKKFFRLDINGPQIGTGLNHQARFDIAGIPENVLPNDNSDRNDNLATIGVHGIYDETSAKGLSVKVTTSQSAI